MLHAIGHCSRNLLILPISANLAKKKAIINMKDKECLNWALRAALFPPRDGKDLQRPSKYLVNGGIT